MVWAAALFLVPALGMAMGVVWIATFVGFAFAACMILLETVKAHRARGEMWGVDMGRSNLCENIHNGVGGPPTLAMSIAGSK